MANGFVKNVKSELKKVIWPTKKQLMNNTFLVVLLVLALAAIVIVFDLIVQGLDTSLWQWIQEILA